MKCMRGLAEGESPHHGRAIDVPEYYNFGFDTVDAWAVQEPSKLALFWVNQEREERRYTFKDLKRESDRVAGLLQAHGIRRGDRVFLLLPRIPEWWIAILACIKVGAVYSPAPTMLTEKDLMYRLQIGRFRMVITDEEHVSKFDTIRGDCPSVESYLVVDGEREGWTRFDARSPSFSHSRAEQTRSTDPLVIFFTSGTTGYPKMVLHNHAYPLGHITTARLWQDLRPDDLHFTLSDTGWAKSAWGNLYGQWIEGATVFVYDIRGKFNPMEIPPLLEDYPITTFCAPPTVYRMLVLEDGGHWNFPSLRHCVSAGEPLNPEVIRIWKERTGLTIREGYGQTETTLCIGTFPGVVPKPGSIGIPAPGWRIELHDREGRPVGINREGRIAIALDPRPVGLFVEYLENEAANRKSFVRGWYYTDDRAAMDEDGYLWFIGRADDVIKSSGYRIGPFEVESALLEHPVVAEAAAVGSPDPVRGEIVKAFVVLKKGSIPSEALVSELQEHVKRITAPYKYPRAIEFVDRLPKTISGKIRRNVLRERERLRSQEHRS
jgi:acetyl-CoA synthetase